MNKVLAFLICFGFLMPMAFADDRVILVSATAEKSLDPNMIRLQIEIWAKAPTAKQAQQLAATQFKEVKKVFQEFKLKNQDIQTENYNLNPDYVYDNRAQQNKLVGFRAVQALSVTLRKIEDAGKFIDAIVSEKQGTNWGVNVNSISWDSDKRTQVETEALGDAVRETRVKANEIAKAAGVKIKNVARISHGTPAQRPPMPFLRGVNKMAMAESVGSEMASGQIKIQVEVSAEYEIN